MASISAGSSCSFAHLLPSLKRVQFLSIPVSGCTGLCSLVFRIPGLLSPEAYFCLIYLTLLLNLYHHACLFSSPDFTLICQWLWKEMTAEFLMDLAPSQHGKRTELMSPRALSLAQVSPFHWAQQISYICGVWHCKEFNLETRFPLLRPCSMFKPTSLPIGERTKKCRLYQSCF